MSSRYRFLFLMDPYSRLNLETETSLLLMKELLSRDHQVFWLEASGLYLKDDALYGEVSRVSQVTPLHVGVSLVSSLDEFDALLIRKDPPFDQSYLHLTLLFEHLSDRPLQFNSSASLRNFNEKLLPLLWPDLAAPTLVSADERQIHEFLALHKTIILKPLDDCSGKGIERISLDRRASEIIHRYMKSLTAVSPFIMAQRFLQEVHEGDKRVYLVNGEAIGWVNRIPRRGQYLANIHQGATCEATRLTGFEKDVIHRISPFLVKEGIFFAGLDFIGDHLTEVNITSPSAICQINQVMNERLEVPMVDAMVNALDARKLDNGVRETASC